MKDSSEMCGKNYTFDEYQKLRTALETYGANYKKIEEAVGTRSDKQCYYFIQRLAKNYHILNFDESTR